MNKLTIKKYQIPTPRYTSYPTVPYWESSIPAVADWFAQAHSIVENNRPISLYIHLPFCENLCTYCGCHKRITKNHKVEAPYIKALIQEWNIYKENAFKRSVKINEIHLGGGTPTFFAPDQLNYLITQILKNNILTKNAALSFEAHPANTTQQHLKVLHQLGFRRISIGVQEFSPTILAAINRKQTTEQIVELNNQARKIGYTSINFDLLYGLPHQSLEDIHLMMDQVQKLQPDRIAYYGYAHVPWIKPSQQAYSIDDLPKGLTRWNLFSQGKKSLVEMGYQTIGMDHFALPTDELVLAAKEKKLHRNFMGYTPQFTNLLIGLGASSISDSWSMYVQNEKKIERYQRLVANGQLPIFRGHQLTTEDEIIRQHILNIMCHYETSWMLPNMQTPSLKEGITRLQPMAKENLIKLDPENGLRVTSKGRPFIRNISMMLDARYWRHQKSKENQFSQSL